MERHRAARDARATANGETNKQRTLLVDFSATQGRRALRIGRRRFPPGPRSRQQAETREAEPACHPDWASSRLTPGSKSEKQPQQGVTRQQETATSTSKGEKIGRQHQRSRGGPLSQTPRNSREHNDTELKKEMKNRRHDIHFTHTGLGPAAKGGAGPVRHGGLPLRGSPTRTTDGGGGTAGESAAGAQHPPSATTWTATATSSSRV